MTIILSAFDHIPIYVEDIEQATRWYKKISGFEISQPLLSWYHDGGPLTLVHGALHLALFKRVAQPAGNTVAFRCSANPFILTKAHLAANKVFFTEREHQFSWSLYFSDPCANRYEITCYKYNTVLNT